MTDGICFDMDGVLVQSEDYWTTRQREWILPRVAPNDEIPLSEITGRDYSELYPDLDKRYDLAVSRAEFEGLFEEAGEQIYREDAHFLGGAHELLADLEAAGIPLALTTSAPTDWIEAIDDRFGLCRHFDAVVSAEHLDGPGKPAPDIYERGAAELGVDPTDCTAIEDSTAGAHAASAAGMWTIGFRGDGDEADLSVADEVVDGVEELRAALLGE